MSALKSILVAAVISTAFAGSAFAQAQGQVFTVKLAAPVSEPTRVIANNTIWNCDGDTCTARPRHAVSLHACRAFTRSADGLRVASYGQDGNELTSEQVARCNGDAAPITTQASN